MTAESVAPDFFLANNSNDFDLPLSFFEDSESSPLSDLSECSSPPRSSITDFDTCEDAAEERRCRLAHKRDLARENRKRKKSRVLELQSTVMALQSELERERKRSQPMVTTTPLCAPVCNTISLAGIANPEATLCAYVENFMAKVQENHMQLNQVQTCIVPCLALRFVQWVLSRNDKFYTDPASLWFSLFIQEVGSSPTQLEHLLALRKAYSEMSPITLHSGGIMMDQAFDALRRSLDESARLFGNFLQIFNPPQLLVFLQWVESFGAVCIKINV